MKQHKEFMAAMPDQTKKTIENCDDSFNLSFSEESLINDIKINSPLKGGNFDYRGPKLDECGGAQQKDMDPESQDVMDYDAMDHPSESKPPQSKQSGSRKQTNTSQFNLSSLVKAQK